MEAVNALHTHHSTTDVHETGGIAGQALTDHCAWTCKALDAHLNPVTMKIEGDMSRRFHEEVLKRYEDAENALTTLLT